MAPVAQTENHDLDCAGLTSAQAAARLRDYGPNRIAEPERHPVRALLAKLNGPVPWMLEASLLLEVFLHNWIEAVIIAVLLVLNAVLAFTQEQRAASASLRSGSS
jgi:H+-transporting ATPase